MSDQTKWNIADTNGNINVPDYLDPLINKVGTQMRLHTISGKGEVQTICDIVYGVEKFFNDINAEIIVDLNELKQHYDMIVNSLLIINSTDQDVTTPEEKSALITNTIEGCSKLLKRAFDLCELKSNISGTVEFETGGKFELTFKKI